MAPQKFISIDLVNISFIWFLHLHSMKIDVSNVIFTVKSKFYFIRWILVRFFSTVDFSLKPSTFVFFYFQVQPTVSNQCENNRRKCRNGGICELLADGRTICRCPENTSGSYCEHGRRNNLSIIRFRSDRNENIQSVFDAAIFFVEAARPVRTIVDLVYVLSEHKVTIVRFDVENRTFNRIFHLIVSSMDDRQ